MSKKKHNGFEISSGPDLDPNKSNSCHLTKKAEKAKAKKDHDYLKEAYSQNESVNSARSSFSQALKECQDRRFTLFRKQDRRRPASLDLNNHQVTAATSPHFGVMKKGSAVARRSGTVLSPGTPKYGNNSVSTQKGWSSERVPSCKNGNRWNTNVSLFPLSNGRTLPSKWDDAERWIISPNAGDVVVRNSVQQQQRRPKSKSGPLGPPGTVYNNSLHSPIGPMFDGGCVGNLVGEFPFSAGALVPDRFLVRSSLGSTGAAGMFVERLEPYMTKSASIHGCTEPINQLTHQGHHVKKIDRDKDASANISRVARRDMATQMSPESSCQSSPISRLSFSLSTPSAFPIVEMESLQSSNSDVRDVKIDDRVTVTRWSKKNKTRFLGKVLENSNDWKRKAMEVRSSPWKLSESAKGISATEREEAKIRAWENLQKAKAEAAMRRLEMKIEKKRSSSMDKIMNKLRSAQKKAQEMRSLMLSNQPRQRQISKTSYKVASFEPSRPSSSLSSCFICPAF